MLGNPPRNYGIIRTQRRCGHGRRIVMDVNKAIATIAVLSAFALAADAAETAVKGA